MAKPDELDGLLGPLEAEVVRAAWTEGRPVTVRRLLDRLNRRRRKDLAYTTVMTVMSRLTDKGVMRRFKDGRGYAYEPVAPDPAGLAVHGVLRDFGDAAVAHFVEEAREDPQVLARLRRLLEDDG